LSTAEAISTLWEFNDYLWALAGYGKWLVTGGPYLVENIVKRVKPKWIAWLDGRISARLRNRVEIGIILIAIFIAGFLAWRDEHIGRLQAEARSSANHQVHNRDAIKQQLQLFYAEGQKLAEGPPSKEPEQYQRYEDSIREWRPRVSIWMDEHMGPGASSKFRDYMPYYAAGLVGFQGSDPQETWDRNYVSYLCRNLDAMTGRLGIM
jgi:hypothetical protein